MDGDSTGRPPPAATSIRFHLPAPSLRAFVTAYYLIDSPGPLAEALHPEWGNIRFSLRGCWRLERFDGESGEVPPHASLFGPTDRTRRVETDTGCFIGVGLTPIGWLKVVRGDASRLANRFVDLGDTLGVAGCALATQLAACPDDAARCALLDATLARRVDWTHPDEAAAIEVQRIVVADAAETIDDLLAATGQSHRTLNRLCLRVFGFGPKRLLRRQRFLRTLARLRDRLDRPLAALLEEDYYDQAHFIREFRAFMGMTPTAYFASPREVMRQVAEERLRVIGAPVQGLHVD